MNAQEIINSGKLEMYVCGSLPTEEIADVEKAIATFPEVKKETEHIEESLIRLAENVAPPLPAMLWAYILNTIRKVKTLDRPETKTTNWAAMSGWAAAILFICGIFWMMNQQNNLRDELQVTTIENNELKESFETTESELAETNDILEILRSKEYQAITLPGNQAVAPDAYAKVYLNKKDNIVYIDARGLPTPPEGKVYQVWSLIMDPLTPTSLGLIGGTQQVENGIYRFENFPTPEAFGITLEPEGGSESPTLSQLYTLGMVTI